MRQLSMYRAVALIVVSCSLGASPSVAAQAPIAEPARVLERVEAPFPPAAKAAGVEGEVRFHATVDASGRVQRVDVDSVPQPGLGFEDVVRAAVSRWRFAPALLRGKPSESNYNGLLQFTLTLPGQAMLGATSLATWNAVRLTMRELGIPIDKAEDRTQLLTTGPFRYIAVKLPDAATLSLPPGYKPDRLTLHVYVTPGMQPARIAVGSIMDVVPMAANERNRFVMYGDESVARWFLSELARRMGVKMEPMAASAQRRAAQSQALMPPGMTDPCSTKAARMVDPAGSSITAPKKLYNVQPMYPSDQLEARKTATVVFRGEITEHGTLVNPTMTEPAGAPASFVASAQLAFGLWKFAPGQQDGCPVRVKGEFRSEFKLE